MRRRRRLGVVLVAIGMASVALALVASPASADAPEQTGWWFELQTKTLPAPLPSLPTVPDGGIYVQQGPQGPVAYGALRYRVASGANPGDTTTASLTLTAAQGSTTSLGAPLQACATSKSWQAPKSAPGNWEDAPTFGQPCTPGRISSDGTVVAFAFDASFVRDGALDVAVVPIEGASPFAIAFDKPAADAFAVTVRSAPPSAVPGASAVVPSGGGAATAGGGGGVGGARPASSVAPAAPAAVAAPASNRPAIASSILNAAGLGDPDRGERAMALGGASLIVVGWWLLSSRAVPAPTLIGALSGAAKPERPEPTRTGGIGRFARTRSRKPLTLR